MVLENAYEAIVDQQANLECTLAELNQYDPCIFDADENLYEYKQRLVELINIAEDASISIERSMDMLEESFDE